MKCFNCGKTFDYEKYYGICPRCGCFNKQETKEEIHQELPGKAFVQADTGRRMQGSTKFLLISIALFLVVFVGGTIFGMVYEDSVEKKLQQELMDQEITEVAHEMGELFEFQESMQLSVTDCRVLATDEDLNLPGGKMLLAVKLEGTSDGQWKDSNELSDAYIRIGERCYWQIGAYEYEAYGEVYRCPAWNRYDLSGSDQAEGWLAFLVDRDVRSVILCLEERTGENQIQIVKIHQIPVQISEVAV